MKLWKGISGFRHVDDPPLPVCDLKTFRTHCHAVVQLLGGRVVRNARRLDGVAVSFAMALLEMPDGLVAVLLNNYFPLVAFANPPSDNDSGPLRFIDCEKVADALRQFGVYEVLNRAELERTITRADLKNLYQTEIEQAEYWQPARVGDVVFNYWD